MRKIFGFLMVTLDGYHETTDGDLSWHNVDAEFHEFAVAQLDEADTLLFGRKTYLGMAAFWVSPAAMDALPATTERMNGYKKLVVSSTLTSADWAPSTLISDDVPARLARVKELPGRDIALIGSSELTASLLGTGLLDELRIMVNPVVLGAGHPALAGASRTSLALTRTRQFDSGNTLLVYRPGS
ncbi:MAG: dihydrofolate reductase family protein [Streptosporangiaceae bacterium]